MNKLHKKIGAGCLAALVALTSTLGITDTYTAKAENNTTLHGPTIGDTVTWDCVYFGSYPQTEITVATDSNVYNSLQNAAGWDHNGDITIGTEKYHRMQKKDATSTALLAYNWEDDNVYHYFKYEPIKWRVLDVSETEIYLVSDKILDTQRFNHMATPAYWEECMLRSWLNGFAGTESNIDFDFSKKGFIFRAFTAEEQDQLVLSGNEKIKLLTLNEVSESTSANYGFISDEARKCLSSDYAHAMGVYFDTMGFSKWWLSTSGATNLTALYIQPNGVIYTKGSSVAFTQNGIRPAIHLSHEAEQLYTYAGTVSSDGTQQLPDPTATPIPSPTTVVTITVSPTPANLTSTPAPTVTQTITPTTTPSVTPSATPSLTPTVNPSATSSPVTATPSPEVTTTVPTPSEAASPTPIQKLPTVAISPTAGTQATPVPTGNPTVKKGTVFTDTKTKAVYKVTKVATKTAGTVQYVKPTSNNVTTVTIPATIKINKKTYKVTSIANKALQKKKKLKKVVIGKNISSIGKNAFYGCKKLKTIQIKTTKLKSKKVGKNAFKGIYKNAKIKVPSKKLKAYKKILKSAGAGKNVKITK